MDSLWRDGLWQQFGAAVDMLDNALVACPDALWGARIWPDPPEAPFPPQFAEFWYVSYHTLVWLDLYLSGEPEEEFAHPDPFIQGELDSVETTPEEPYTRELLRAYLAALRRKLHATLAGLTTEEASQPVEYPWSEGQPVSYLELLLYTMRHTQEHAAQLSLFLGQHGVQGDQLDSVARARDDKEEKDDPGGG